MSHHLMFIKKVIMKRQQQMLKGCREKVYPGILWNNAKISEIIKNRQRY